ncbi:MAG: DedA family protein [Caldisphaera sp.]|nr:MAG: alkaline phosphatase [Caldisphaera sp.]PMP92077.1 MAG: alkaline phosphatase [Caldisphaera sp.]
MKKDKTNLIISIVFFLLGIFIIFYHSFLGGNLTKFFINLSINILIKGGYYGILALMIAESALIPIPSEIVMPLAGIMVKTNNLNLLAIITAGTIGNLIGSTILYYIGKYIRNPFISFASKYLGLKKKYVETADQLFNKHGSSVILSGRVMPAVRSVISLPAGFANMNIVKFALFTFIGSLPWNIVLSLIGYFFGTNNYVLSMFDYIVSVFIFILGIYYLLRYLNFLKNK